MLSERREMLHTHIFKEKDLIVPKNASTYIHKSLDKDSTLKKSESSLVTFLDAEEIELEPDFLKPAELNIELPKKQKKEKKLPSTPVVEAEFQPIDQEEAGNIEDDDSLLLIEEDSDFDESADAQLLAFDDISIVPALGEREESNLPQVRKTHLPNTLIKDNLQLYLREISAFPLLKPEEELEFAQRVKENGDPDAAFRLVSSHLRLVVKIAMEFQRRWMQNVLDLVQEGNIGLLRAVNKFDPDKGIKFSYYATFWIRAYILKFIMDNWRMVKIGTTQAQRKLFYNLNKEKQKLISQGFDPDINVLSERLGVSKEQVAEMEQRLDSTDMSLDMPISEDSGSASRIDYLPALTQGVEEGFAESEVTEIIREKIDKLLPKLTDKEVFILENRLLTDDPVTLREIGEKYNVTRERIRQLEARLVTKMRLYLTSEIDDFSEEWIQEK